MTLTFDLKYLKFLRVAIVQLKKVQHKSQVFIQNIVLCDLKMCQGHLLSNFRLVLGPWCKLSDYLKAKESQMTKGVFCI